jgi:hypothetical protein
VLSDIYWNADDLDPSPRCFPAVLFSKPVAGLGKAIGFMRRLRLAGLARGYVNPAVWVPGLFLWGIEVVWLQPEPP